MNVVEEKDPYETINIDSNKCQIINILTTCCRKKNPMKILINTGYHYHPSKRNGHKWCR